MKGWGNKEGRQRGRWETPTKRDFLLSFNDRGLALCEDAFFVWSAGLCLHKMVELKHITLSDLLQASYNPLSKIYNFGRLLYKFDNKTSFWEYFRNNIVVL